ncbi:tetraacyldisaccharide 4'-kinase [Chelativorans sp. AA-79]|uniref:tetraacyldisaccharide 4'-kinase n=1 Tax=Chelativorans sp. AA-79 TaxID=3028735 RepID=UPI0023F90E0E|nr:tetraacyldisaccharide 4'-kinase [Chelativorans sp. AA-79]WEX08421.1 tetraacyldisaccharide 4'-kinase [Chelativorans sp. AA-79]
MATGDAPPFWWEKPDWRAWALWPVSSIYGFAARTRMRTARREKVAAAVLCIGNLTVGGEGKTPVAIALAREAKARKLKVGFLSRGYGGSFSAPHLVNPEEDSARVVGDEPLLLARHALTVVTPDRAAGARRLVQAGCELIVMDDGFQSARIHMDYALIVVDARRGLGNGHVIPGGPLRAPLVDQMRFADAIVTMGQGSAADAVVRSASRAGRPVFAARIRPRGRSGMRGKRVLAFAGIGNPQKFYATLQEAGAEVVATRSFPDHHPFSEEEVGELASRASADGLTMVTTEKDLVRLRHAPGNVRDFAASVVALPVEAVFEEPGAPDAILRDTMAAWRERMMKG